MKEITIRNEFGEEIRLMIEPYGRWYSLPPGSQVVVRNEKYDLGEHIELCIRPGSIDLWVEGGTLDFLSELNVTAKP